MSTQIITAIIAAAASLLGSAIVSYFANNKTTELILYRLKILEEKQDKHNSLIERMYKVEESVKVLEQREKVSEHRIEDLENK